MTRVVDHDKDPPNYIGRVFKDIFLTVEGCYKANPQNFNYYEIPYPLAGTNRILKENL